MRYIPAFRHLLIWLACFGILLVLAPDAISRAGSPSEASIQAGQDGTPWRLKDPPLWTEADLEPLDALVKRLPPAWRAPKRPIMLVKAPAPALPADPFVPHLIAVEVDPGVIVLKIDHLGDRIASWLETLPQEARPPDLQAFRHQLIQRQLVHALTHRVDDEQHWSRGDDWRGLAGWSRSRRHAHSAELDPDAYARPEGRQSPEEDFATMAEAYFVPWTDPRGIDYHVRCRLPARWRYFQQQTGPHPDPAPEVQCARLDQIGLDPEKIDHLELVYVAPTLSSAASLAGHVLIALAYRPDALGIARHDAYGMVADTTGTAEGTLHYTLMGLTGGFLSRVVWEPFEATLLRYSEIENRDVRRYRLVLTEAQKRVVLVRLDELRQSWKRPYYFFQRNCTELPFELLEPLLGAGGRPPRPYAPEVLMAWVGRLGLLERLPIERPQELGLGGRAEEASRLRHMAGVRLIRQSPKQAVPLIRAMDQIADSDVAKRVSAYQTLGAIAGVLGPDALAELNQILAWSDLVEQAEQLSNRQKGVVPLQPGVEAIRSAMADVREAAIQRGLAPSSLPTGQAQLVVALEHENPAASMHTPFQPIAVLSSFVRHGGETSSGLSLEYALYRSQLGEARRFNLGQSIELELLASEIRLGVFPDGGLRVKSRLIDVLSLPQSARPIPLGWRWKVGDMDYQYGASPRFQATWLEARGVVGLWQTDSLERSLRLSAGLSVQSDVNVKAADQPPTLLELGMPLALEVRVGSSTQALTGLHGGLTWRPLLTLDGRFRQQLDVDALLRVRVAELGGIDVALGARYRGRWEDSRSGTGMALEHEFQAGVWLERF